MLKPLQLPPLIQKPTFFIRAMKWASNNDSKMRILICPTHSYDHLSQEHFCAQLFVHWYKYEHTFFPSLQFFIIIIVVVECGGWKSALHTREKKELQCFWCVYMKNASRIILIYMQVCIHFKSTQKMWKWKEDERRLFRMHKKKAVSAEKKNKNCNEKRCFECHQYTFREDYVH